MPTAAKTLLFSMMLTICLCGPATTGCPIGDLTNDCIVNLDDIHAFTEMWLSNPSEPADLEQRPQG